MKNIVIIAVAHSATGGDLMKRGKGTKAVMHSLVIGLKLDLCLTSTYHLYFVVSDSYVPPPKSYYFISIGL